MSWLQIGAVLGVVALVIYRVFPRSLFKRAAKKPDPMQATLQQIAPKLIDHDDFDAFRRLVELME
jgi:hypothetical protein|tara:strand:- start:439 stop:633 length:195 start_codon:yes stop_codon:yes gene_type:complete